MQKLKFIDKLVMKEEIPETIHKRVQRKLANAQARIKLYEKILQKPVRKNHWKLDFVEKVSA